MFFVSPFLQILSLYEDTPMPTNCRKPSWGAKDQKVHVQTIICNYLIVLLIVKLKKNVLTETQKKNWAGQHSELLYWTTNGQFKMENGFAPRGVSTIPLGALTKP